MLCIIHSRMLWYNFKTPFYYCISFKNVISFFQTIVMGMSISCGDDVYYWRENRKLKEKVDEFIHKNGWLYVELDKLWWYPNCGGETMTAIILLVCDICYKNIKKVDGNVRFHRHDHVMTEIVLYNSKCKPERN